MPHPSHASRRKGIITAVAAGTVVSVYFMINTMAMTWFGADTVPYALLVMLCGGLVPAVLIARQWATFRQITPRLHARLMGLTCIGIVATGLVIVGQSLTQVSNVAFVVNTVIIFTAAFAWLFLRHAPTARQVGWLAIMFAGIYVGVIGIAPYEPGAGDGVVILAAMLYGITNVLSNPWSGRLAPTFSVDVRMLYAMLFLLPVVLLTPGIWTQPAIVYGLAIVNGILLWLMTRLFFVAISYIGPSMTIVINNSNLVLTAAIGIMLFGDPFGWEKAVGAVVVLASIYMFTFRSGAKQADLLH